MTDSMRNILEQLAAGHISVDAALEQVQHQSVQSMGFATLDHDRARRCGCPEVIYASGKTPEQVTRIAEQLIARNGYALVTRTQAEHRDAVTQQFSQVLCGHRCGTMLIGEAPQVRGTPIPIVTAGTSDQRIAEEAELTCRAMGQATHLICDVGVAGLARLIARLPELSATGVIICIAGMEGALPSVVGGLVSVPVIAVPTSVGYGAAFGGVAALLGMLTSCAAGVTVVNIDNGFGAAYTATLIQRQFDRTETGTSGRGTLP